MSIVRVLLSLIKHYLLNIFNRNTNIKLSVNEKNFIDLLKKEYEFENIGKNRILMEGDLIKAGPNYFFRLLSLANLFSKKYNLSIDIAFNNYRNNCLKEISMCKKLGLSNFIFTKKISSIKLLLLSYFGSVFVYFKYLYSNTELKNLRYVDVKIGDFIIDSYLKSYGIDCSSTYKDSKIFELIFESVYLINFYNKIIDPDIYKIIIVTHTQYVYYGILARVSYKKGIQVIETTDAVLLLSNPRNNDKIKYPSYHSSLMSMIKARILNLEDKEEFIKNSKKNLDARLSGEFNQYDLIAAYNNKKVYSDSELRHTLKINNKKPFVFILAHVFSDAPLSIGETMLFSDYYDWLIFTIKQAGLNKDINWIVKPHPSSYIYNEDGIVKKIISDLKPDNIFLSPEDFNTSSIQNLAKAIVTARGTAGIEYSCLGIPVILSGNTFYSGFGFTKEPNSKIEYEQILSRLPNIDGLSQINISDALLVYGSFVDLSHLENDPIITSEMLNNVWGANGYQVDIDKAYLAINNNIRRFGASSWSHLRLANSVNI